MDIVRALVDFGIRLAGLTIGVYTEMASAVRSLADDIEQAFTVDELDRG